MVDKNKRGQMKIQQTAFMLMAVTLFFVLVGLFVLVIRVSNLKDTATMLEEENAMLLISKLANSPEFSCGKSFGNLKIACIDADKVMALKNHLDEYSNFWGIENIEIRKIYPIIYEEECNSFSYPGCNIIKLYDEEMEGYSVSNFVSLCRKESIENTIHNKCEIAKLIVSYESKQ